LVEKTVITIFQTLTQNKERSVWENLIPPLVYGIALTLNTSQNWTTQQQPVFVYHLHHRKNCHCFHEKGRKTFATSFQSKRQEIPSLLQLL